MACHTVGGGHLALHSSLCSTRTVRVRPFAHAAHKTSRRRCLVQVRAEGEHQLAPIALMTLTAERFACVEVIHRDPTCRKGAM